MSGTLDARRTLQGERIAFTGRLASLSRRQAEELVRRCGGGLSANVSQSTTLLVVGMGGWPLLPDGQLSNKLQRAEALQRRPRGRGRLRICSEEQFLEMAGRKPPPGAPGAAFADKPMDACQVCDLVGISPQTLGRWELLGLVRSTGGRFDFRDLVSLQTMAALVGQGASPRMIAQSVRSLARVVPGTDRPLAQLKLLADQDTLVAEINGCLMSPSGQLLMRFDPDEGEQGESAETLTLSHASSPTAGRTAQAWFDLGCLHEDAGELEQAERAYREALAIDPQSADANFNLANVLRATNRREAAEERYRVALEHLPDMAEAWFNLADLLDDLGRRDEAIGCLRAAVQAAPHYADAHYNLAVCCEKSGALDEARLHWREYVRLDPTSEWAAFVRAKFSG